MVLRPNAELVEIAGGGTTEDFDAPAGSDTAKWSGKHPAYIVARVRSAVTAGRLDIAKESYGVVRPGLPIEVGDTVTFRRGADVVSHVVRDIEEHKVAGTTRLYFKDE